MSNLKHLSLEQLESAKQDCKNYIECYRGKVRASHSGISDQQEKLNWIDKYILEKEKEEKEKTLPPPPVHTAAYQTAWDKAKAALEGDFIFTIKQKKAMGDVLDILRLIHENGDEL